MGLWWALIKLGFRLLYHELAFTYDMVSAVVSLGAWRCWQRTALRHLPPPGAGRVLELAHGTGNLQLDLIETGYETFAIDFSSQMGRIARHKLRRRQLPVRFSQARAQQLPYPAGVFAGVVSTFPTNFILEPETLREVHRVLQAGGQLIIVPNGVLASGDVAATLLEWLYRITGQREEHPFDLVGYLDRYGFEAQVRQEACPRSVATIVSARKKSL